MEYYVDAKFYVVFIFRIRFCLLLHFVSLWTFQRSELEHPSIVVIDVSFRRTIRYCNYFRCSETTGNVCLSLWMIFPVSFRLFSFRIRRQSYLILTYIRSMVWIGLQNERRISQEETNRWKNFVRRWETLITIVSMTQLSISTSNICAQGMLQIWAVWCF